MCPSMNPCAPDVVTTAIAALETLVIVLVLTALPVPIVGPLAVNSVPTVFAPAPTRVKSDVPTN